MSEIKTIGSELPYEIERCQNLLEHYKALGITGSFGYTIIKNEVNKALQAISEGDTIKMIRSYSQLKKCS